MFQTVCRKKMDEFVTPLTVEELKALNFDKLSKQEKLSVKLRGRPTPMIQLSKPSSSHGKKYIRSRN